MILKITNNAPSASPQAGPHLSARATNLSTMNYCVLESSIVKLIEDVLAPLYFGFKSDSDEGLLHLPFDISLFLYLFELNLFSSIIYSSNVKSQI